jgi:hypothetical protein
MKTIKNLFKIICISLVFFSVKTNAQTLSALQQQNARATGYAIVAARNPGKSFSILLLKWDGVHDLEYNANNQINPFWHPQAVVKGNYFSQSFDGSDFTNYSSVVVSQTEFDTYKSTGTDWWIICSNLPSFSNSSLSVSDNGNVGIGTNNPSSKLEVDTNSQNDLASVLVLKGRTSDETGTNGVMLGFQTEHAVSNLSKAGIAFVRKGGYGTGNLHFLVNSNIDNGQVKLSDAKMSIISNGNVGIGTTNPDSKLTVKGKIHAEEVKIDLAVPADYVFEKYYTGESSLKPDYKLLILTEVEKFTQANHHLPNVPSAKEIKENGLLLGEMSNILLQKIEELTLYAIEQQKENNLQSKEIETLKKENESFKSLSERFSKIENQLKN